MGLMWEQHNPTQSNVNIPILRDHYCELRRTQFRVNTYTGIMNHMIGLLLSIVGSQSPKIYHKFRNSLYYRYFRL